MKATTAHCSNRSTTTPLVHAAPPAHVPTEWLTSVFPQKYEKIFSRLSSGGEEEEELKKGESKAKRKLQWPRLVHCTETDGSSPGLEKL